MFIRWCSLKFCDGTAKITAHLIVAPVDSKRRETSKVSIFMVLWKTHASTYFKDRSHWEAKGLRRALHLNIYIDQVFLSSIGDIYVICRNSFVSFWPNQKCRGRCVRIQNADDADHFRSRFLTFTSSCCSILRSLRSSPPFENRFYSR